MADNIILKDGNGVVRTLRSTDSAGIHTPHHNVFGPLTDTELRATAVPVSGPVTDTQLRAAPIAVTGPATNAEIRATPIPVSGPLTDTQLRASSVPVTGPLTDAELRVQPVIVRPQHNYPISSGVFSVGSVTPVAIVAPDGATGVFIYPRSGELRYAVDFDPVIPADNTLAAGGIAKANLLRDQVIKPGEELRLLSPDTGSAAVPVLVDVSFYGIPMSGSFSL